MRANPQKKATDHIEKMINHFQKALEFLSACLVPVDGVTRKKVVDGRSKKGRRKRK